MTHTAASILICWWCEDLSPLIHCMWARRVITRTDFYSMQEQNRNSELIKHDGRTCSIPGPHVDTRKCTSQSSIKSYTGVWADTTALCRIPLPRRYLHPTWLLIWRREEKVPAPLQSTAIRRPRSSFLNYHVCCVGLKGHRPISSKDTGGGGGWQGNRVILMYLWRMVSLYAAGWICSFWALQEGCQIARIGLPNERPQVRCVDVRLINKMHI